MKKYLLVILAAIIFWSFAADALAAIQLEDTLRPENLPEFSIETDEDLTTEETATRTIILFVGNIVSQVLLFAGAISIISLIVSGANYIFAFGKEERIEKGKRGAFWSIMGLLVILLSYAIIQGIISVVVQLDVAAT